MIFKNQMGVIISNKKLCSIRMQSRETCQLYIPQESKRRVSN